MCRYETEVGRYTNYANPNPNDYTKWGHFTQVCGRIRLPATGPLPGLGVHSV